MPEDTIWKKKLDFQKKSSKSRHVRPFNNFMFKSDLSYRLFLEIKKSIKDEALFREAKSQFIISCITVFEVYFRDLFLVIFKLCTTDILERCKNILKNKFSLEDIIYVYSNNIEISDFISSFINFQNLQNIEKVFSAFLEKSFFDSLKGREFKSRKSNGIPFKLKDDYYLDLKNFIELRHLVVHDYDMNLEINDDDLDKYYSELLLFITASDVLIHQDFIEPHLKEEFK